MSDVKMCDTCGTVFSVRQENWSTGTGSKFITDPDTGQRKTITIDQDKCPECTELATAPRQPMMLPSQVSNRYDHTD